MELSKLEKSILVRLESYYCNKAIEAKTTDLGGLQG